MSNQSKNTASAYAPGRVELLGNHTDYNEGVVLGAAIDRGLTVRGRKCDDGMISIESSTMGHVEIAPLGTSPARRKSLGELRTRCRQRMIALSIPVEGSLLRSAAILRRVADSRVRLRSNLATALFLLRLYGRNCGSLEIAKACQRADTASLVYRSGLLDQVTSLFGRADHAVFFDCRSEEVRAIPFPQGLALIIAESGKKRELTKGEYNARIAEKRAPLPTRCKSARCVTSLLKRSRIGAACPICYGDALHTSWRRTSAFCARWNYWCRRWAGIRWVDERVTRKFA